MFADAGWMMLGGTATITKKNGLKSRSGQKR